MKNIKARSDHVALCDKSIQVYTTLSSFHYEMKLSSDDTQINANKPKRDIYNQLGCHGNTHWFTWETPGANVSVISLQTQKRQVKDRFVLIVNRVTDVISDIYFWCVRTRSPSSPVGPGGPIVPGSPCRNKKEWSSEGSDDLQQLTLTNEYSTRS